MESFGWVRFWKEQQRAFHDVMKISTTYFARTIERYFEIKPRDQILDYGCGPGFLFDHFDTWQTRLTGADISSVFIEEGKKNHPQALFINITTDPESNERILKNHLGQKEYDYIILLSIVQYFKDVEELGKVIRMLTSFLSKDGKIIVADVIDHETSAVRDVLSVFIHCLKNGKAIAFFRFIFYLIFSEYSTLRKQLPLLEVSEQAMRHIAESHSMYCKKMKGFTIHSTRKNYVLANSPM